MDDWMSRGVEESGSRRRKIPDSPIHRLFDSLSRPHVHILVNSRLILAYGQQVRRGTSKRCRDRHVCLKCLSWYIFTV